MTYASKIRLLSSEKIDMRKCFILQRNINYIYYTEILKILFFM